MKSSLYCSADLVRCLEHRGIDDAFDAPIGAGDEAQGKDRWGRERVLNSAVVDVVRVPNTQLRH
ncbi:hypothetical protein BJF84_20940 [Rhodococcus sp. CUA-806]|nr:hypothetical protein BJF84_20940 [Rhodococcus sp. CUA-806]